MKTAIATGILGLALFANEAVAQTAAERAQILRDFEQSVDAYTRHQCLTVFPEAINAATPAPKIFTLPVAMVFRQLIAHAIAAPAGLAINGVATTHRAAVLEPFPASELGVFPPALSVALPPLPTPLQYRLIDNDLVIRDAKGDLIIAVLRNALGPTTTR